MLALLPPLNAHARPTRMQPMERMPPEDAPLVLRIRPLPRDPLLRLRAIALPIFMETAKPAHAQHVRMVARSRLSLMQMTLPPLIVHVQWTPMETAAHAQLVTMVVIRTVPQV